MHTKEDRRVRKTKKALREALAELLLEKSIQDITVRELTDKADVHRSTFYANYKDIYDLYGQMETLVIQEISEITSMEYQLGTKVFFGVLFRYITDNKKVCRLILGEHGSNAFFNRIASLFKASCVDCLCKDLNLNGKAEAIEPYAYFFLSGSLALIREWVANDFEQAVEELVSMLIELDDIFRQFLKSKFA